MSICTLDTHPVSFAVKRHPQVIQRLLAPPMQSRCISAITAGQLAFGLAKWPQALILKVAVQAFLRNVDVLPWDHGVALSCVTLRAKLQKKSTPRPPFDSQIAAHAWHASATLVSSDKAFQRPRNTAMQASASF